MCSIRSNSSNGCTRSGGGSIRSKLGSGSNGSIGVAVVVRVVVVVRSSSSGGGYN